jgi:antitoxin component of RelBE/YafQ-DinJ toxin-antitoxin module
MTMSRMSFNMNATTIKNASDIVQKEGFELSTVCRAFIANIKTTGKCPLSLEVENQNYTKEKSEDQEEYWVR